MTVEKTTPPIQSGDSALGFGYALAAYLMWGFLPFYLKAVAHISPLEVLAHRVVWSVPIAAAVLILLGRTADLKVALRSPRIILMACLTASLITINWGVYIWAIGQGRALDAALGYFINPLFSILLGAILLKEKLHTVQKAAIALVVVAVVILTINNGGLPWIAIVLTGSWGFYAFFRKTLPVGPNQGFLLEVLLLSIPAIIYIVYLGANGTGNFFNGNTNDTLLLFFSGVATAVPLMLYGNGAKLLRLSTIGIMQYIAPTMIFLVAIFAFKEQFDTIRLIAFSLIWTALIVYSWSMFREHRKAEVLRHKV